MEHRGFLSRVMVRRTKREVTDKNGNPIFVRRQVHTQSFQLALSERTFYEKLTEYLREGYNVAGVGNGEDTHYKSTARNWICNDYISKDYVFKHPGN